MDLENLRLRINNVIDDFIDEYAPKEGILGDNDSTSEPAEAEIVEEVRVLPTNRRAVRASTTGDRVYFIDEEKNTRQWVTNPQVLKNLGFELTDVIEIDEAELLKYQMAPAVYRVDEQS